MGPPEEMQKSRKLNECHSQIVVDVLGWLQVDARHQPDHDGEKAQAEAPPMGQCPRPRPRHGTPPDDPAAPSAAAAYVLIADDGGGRSGGSAT